MATQGPPGVGVVHAAGRWEKGGGSLGRLGNAARPHLAFFHASTCQGARWRMTGRASGVDCLYELSLIFLYEWLPIAPGKSLADDGKRPRGTRRES